MRPARPAHSLWAKGRPFDCKEAKMPNTVTFRKPTPAIDPDVALQILEEAWAYYTPNPTEVDETPEYPELTEAA